MKLNLGLSLKKPCESGYSVLRRFLLVNRGVNITTAKIENALKSVNHPPPKIDYRKLNRLGTLAIEYEYKVLNNNDGLKVRNIAPSSYRPIKQCTSCAKAFYHSYSFDLPWVTVCPTHGVELSHVCPLCKKPWPKINELIKRDECEVCGIDGSEDRIAHASRLNKDVGYSRLRCHQDILEGHEATFPKTFLARQSHEGLSPTKRINRPSRFLVSVLQYNQSLSGEAQEYLRSVDYEFIGVSSTTFKVQDYDAQSKKSSACAQRFTLENVSLDIEKILSRDIEHRVGRCKNNFDDYCFHCEVWFLWCTLVNYKGWDLNFDPYFQFADKLNYIMSPQVTGFYPVYHGLMSKHESNSLKAYEIPPFAIAELYEQNLKTSFIGLYHFLRIRKIFEQIGNQTLVDLFQFLPDYTKKKNFNGSPYLASFNEGMACLYWPTIKLKAALTDPQRYYEPIIHVSKNMHVIDAMSEI